MQIGIIENGRKLSAVEVNHEIYEAVTRVNRVYGAKIQAYYPSRVSAYRMATTLKPDAALEDNDLFRRRSGSVYQGNRRIWAIDYYGHLAFFAELYAANPGAIVRSAMASWDSREDFLNEADAIGDRNIGSYYHPMLYRDASDSNEDVDIAVAERMQALFNL